MDQYANNQNSSYSSLPSIAPQQLQQNASLPPHTLPPLQAQHAAMSMHAIYGQQPLTAPHTPTTTTPNTPSSTNNAVFQQQMNSQPGPRSYQPQSSSYQQPIQAYSSSSMPPHSSGPMSHPQPIAPAPGPLQNRLVPLRPMNASAPLHAQHGMHPHMQPGMQSPYGQITGHEQEAPTHVVGSQGRRGILPSAPGRPTVSATGTGSTKNAMIPAKDADGKFPCPHCTKTYLHAKHLKRHLLRHTGDRPYMCVLCRDTFSRSDILKRHFQKCSIRRGNPTGASHLSHAQAHLKKSHPGPHKTSASSSNDGGDMMRGMNGMNGDPSMAPFGVIVDKQTPNLIPNLTDEQANQEQLSRTNSLKRMNANGEPHDRRNISGPSSGRPSFEQNYNGNVPSTMPPSMNPQLAAFNMNGHPGPSFGQSYDFASQNNNGNLHGQGNEGMAAMANGRGAMPMFGGPPNGQQSNVDWTQMFQPGAQDAFMNTFNTNLSQNQMAIKAEPSLPNTNDGVYTGMYPMADGTSNPPHNFPSWNFPTLQHDPLQQISNQLIRFCCPPGSHMNLQGGDIRSVLSADNIKHLLEQYTNFQGHFPIIHMPTFHITEVYPGLLLAMICIGAVYSERFRPTQVRELMEQIKTVIERDSRIFSTFQRDHLRDPSGESSYGEDTITGSKDDIEQIQAIVLMQWIFVWHGTPIQREMARRKYYVIVKISRAAQLSRPSTIPQSFSVLHQPNVTVEHFSAASFDWNTWVEQEKRSRLFYNILLMDCAMAIYFNNPPSLDALEISLPLPADDAAWDARTATQCAEALGLHGPIAARDRNSEGSRRAKQPEMHSALRALLDGNLSLKAGTTNLYSKFLLVHALHAQIWLAQHSQELENGSTQGHILNRSGTSTPTSQTNGQTNGIPNGRQGHNEGQPEMSLVIINSALDKWKKTWDEDMSIQYPPASTNYRRFGFCRDGVHFFYLAKYLLKNRLDWRMAPDQRFSQVMHLLKSVKTWVVSDSANRGEELGSVSDIDKEYGATDLTLDMAQLFKPINKLVDSPIPGVHTNLGNGGMI